jgi:ribosomal protein L22
MNSAIAASFASASASQTQIALGAEMLKMNAQAAASIVEVLEAAIQNAQAALPAGVGANLDISV